MILTLSDLALMDRRWQVAVGMRQFDCGIQKLENCKRRSPATRGWINPVAFSSDGQTLASGSHDQRIRFWDAQTGEYKSAFPGHTGHIFSVAFSPDGTTLASGSEDGTVRLWELTPMTPLLIR